MKVSFALVNDRRMKKIKKQFWGKAENTDVAAFPIGEKDPEDGVYFAGEVVVNLDQARRQAKELGVSVDEEVVRLITHGALHLLGYKDETPRPRRKMEKMQEKVVKRVINSPIPNPQ